MVFDLPSGIVAENTNDYTYLVSHLTDAGIVELLTPILRDGKLVVTVHSLSPFGISWLAKAQPAPTAAPSTPAPSSPANNAGSAAVTFPKGTAVPTKAPTVSVPKKAAPRRKPKAGQQLHSDPDTCRNTRSHTEPKPDRGSRNYAGNKQFPDAACGRHCYGITGCRVTVCLSYQEKALMQSYA